MNLSNELFPIERSAYRLQRLEVFNWGPFSGLHSADIDPDGTAIIGMTGSGKTTLVDAFVTLITEKPKYNLASTGGHESDRDLISYVRGVIGSGNDSGDGAHISRKGSVITGLCATYRSGDETVRIAGLLWIEGNSFSNSDLKRAWVFSRNPEHSLEQWLSLLDEGGLRRLKQVIRDDADGVRIFDTASGGKRAYLARVRDFFGVSDNAFNLLNRAAGLKQLNSIDMIFRELVLDDQALFERAAEVAGDFDRLTEIHEELLTAQRQIASLRPVAKKHQKHLEYLAELELNQQLKQLLPLWIAENGHRLWTIQAESARKTHEEATSALRSLEAKNMLLEADRDACHERYLQTGGSNIEDLEARIGDKRKERRRIETNVTAYRQLCANLEIKPEADVAAFESQKKTLHYLLETTRPEEANVEKVANTAGAELANSDAALTRIEEEYAEAKKRTDSNLPSDAARFRDALAEAIDLAPEALPFVAELVEVKESESAWRGAIERALGGNRLRILVPTPQIKPALHWVNAQSRYRLHIRLLEAEVPSAPARFMEDGYARKLNFKSHELREALKAFLANYDLHCVGNSDVLSETQHALTREGLMSGKRGFFEKKDQKGLHEDWLTGFDNRDRIRMLEKHMKDARATRDSASREAQSARQRLKSIGDKLTAIEQLQGLPFEDVDLAAVEAALQQLEQRLQRLLDPDSDAAKSQNRYQKAKQRVEDIQPMIRQAATAVDRAKDELQSAEQKRDDYLRQIGNDGLTVNESALAREHLPIPDSTTAVSISNYDRHKNTELETRRSELLEDKGKLEFELAQSMKDAQSADTGALAEVGTDIADVPAYVQRLQTLTTEDLPAKRTQFLNYLNQSSDQGVAQLLTSITQSVEQIRERIDELNESLLRVDFKNDCYLRLVVQDVSHESLRSLERARKVLHSARLQSDEDTGERHYKALREVVNQVREAADKKHTVGARALLDPRYRVEFYALEVERSTGAIKGKFTGSQGGSGGEKEIIASYILTASLCYALSPQGSTYPLHSTIVLDEAFSKSSRAVAARIIQALREFKLHPIFVTPNKEMRLLRTHTRSAIYIHRKVARATMTSISWEDLENRINAAASPSQTERLTKDEDA